ncbi:MAG TPA: hypothetical protein VFX05_05490, partial [Casimicrobiaceae bacterium]|nr:hypothetical protein [Casimicrobiaceae bacterium]
RAAMVTSRPDSAAAPRLPALGASLASRDAADTDRSADLVVERARVVACRRADPGRATVGDEAIAELGPGLLRLLSMADAHGRSLGEGGGFPWTIPVGVAATAAYAVMEPVEGINVWTGVKNAVHYHRPGRPGETLVASCRLAALGLLAETPYRVWSRDRGDLLVEGCFLSASAAADEGGLYGVAPREDASAVVEMRNATAPLAATDRAPAPSLDEDRAPHASPTGADYFAALPPWSDAAPAKLVDAESESDPVVVLRAPRVLRRIDTGEGAATWEWLFPRDLLQLLAHPVAGGRDPLGRRHHPYGRLLEGMAIHAALAMNGGGLPREARVRLSAPMRGAEDFRLRASQRGGNEALRWSDHEIYEGERPLGRVRIAVEVNAALPASDERPPR